MRKNIILQILLGIVLFALGIFLGYKLFHQAGSPECPTPPVENIDYEDTSDELVNKYNISANHYSGITSRGYYIEEKNGKYYLTISMGQKNTGGYSLFIKSVTKKDKILEIVVGERSPKLTDTVTQALTTPAIYMELETDNIKVINDQGMEYAKLK